MPVVFSRYKVEGYGKHGGITCDLETVVTAAHVPEAEARAREQFKDYRDIAFYKVEELSAGK